MRWAAAVAIALGAISANDVRGEAWSFGVQCPGSGASFWWGDFLTSNSNGFSATGRCTRTNTKFTEITLNSYTGGTPTSTTQYLLHTGDVLIVPPMLTTDLSPVFSVATTCPGSNQLLNWIYVRYGNSIYSLSGGLVLGSSSYDVANGITVDGRYDIEGSIAYSGNVSLPGACASGVYQLNGIGDRSGSIYLNQTGGGVSMPSNNRVMFFFPQRTVTASQFDARTLQGVVFENDTPESVRHLRATGGSGGNVLTIEPFSDVANDVIDVSGTGFVDVLTFTNFNDPKPGMLFGTIERTGYGAGTGRVACIAKEDTNLQLICTGESPQDNAIPFTMVLVYDGLNVLGQVSPSNDDYYEHSMATPHAASSDGTRLFVADRNNNRVLIWNTMPTGRKSPDVVLGQNDMIETQSNLGGVSAKTLYNPADVFSDGTRVFVADQRNHRVLIWTSMPTTPGAPANIVLGQPNMTSSSSGAGPSSMNRPFGVHYDGTKLFVADYYNHRVLIWNSLPSANGAPADVVLGQADMNSVNQNRYTYPITGAVLNYPTSVSSDGTRLVVGDEQNHRVLIWNSIPTTNGVTADVVLGQATMATGSSNPMGSPTASTFFAPVRAQLSGGKLFVADRFNNRGLIWNTIPTSNGTPADVVVGQANMTSGVEDYVNRSAYMFGGTPYSLYSDGTRLFAADSNGNRVMIWNTVPTANFTPADVAVGVESFTSTWSGVTNGKVISPESSFIYGSRLIVADKWKHRVLIWNSIPATNQAPADIVLGQPDMTSSTANNGGVSAQSLNVPTGVFVQDGRLFVADNYNHRVLVWDSIPTANQTPADYVLGQPNMTSNTANNGGISAQSFWNPYAVHSDGTRLFVSESSNNRVLIWNTVPTTTRAAANVVLGQPSMTVNTYNNGGVSAQSLYYPQGIYSNGTRLFVGDTYNNRVLIWNTMPTTNRAAASLVLGQPAMNANTANNGGISGQSFTQPVGVDSDGTKLYVSDYNNHRILVWNTLPTTNRAMPDIVIGQPDMTSRTPNNGGLSGRTLKYPTSVLCNGVRLYISDSSNQRLLVIPRL